MPLTNAWMMAPPCGWYQFEFLFQVAAVLEEAIADVALEFLRAEDFGHGAGGLPAP